jgi:hypothetical protein
MDVLEMHAININAIIGVRPQGTGLFIKEVKDFGYYSLALV